MKYPTMNEVETASQLQLCKWYRFLPLPFTFKYPKIKGRKISGIEYDMRRTDQERQMEILNRIIEKYRELGGMTTKISKKIGWEEGE